MKDMSLKLEGKVEQDLLGKFSRALLYVQDLEKLLNFITNLIVETLGVEQASLTLSSEEYGEYKSKEGFRILDSHVCVPLTVKDKLIGALNVNGKRSGGEYNPDDLRLLSSLADVVAVTVDHAFAHNRVLNQLKVRQEDLQNRRQEEIVLWERIAMAMAHEIKNSLVSSSALTEMFLEKYKDEEFRRTFNNAVRRDTTRLNNFTERLISFAQPCRPNLKPCNIHGIIDQAASLVISEKKPKDFTLIKEYMPELPEVMADSQQLKEVFIDLISNSVEAMSLKGKLTITTGIRGDLKMSSQVLISREIPKDNFVIIRFADTGAGILQENFSKLFNPFFSTKKVRLGLGLTIAAKIIKAHNGFIELVTSVPEKGTTFDVYLPC